MQVQMVEYQQMQSNKCLWRVELLRGDTPAGAQVPVGRPVVLRHLNTGKYLCSDQQGATSMCEDYLLPGELLSNYLLPGVLLGL